MPSYLPLTYSPRPNRTAPTFINPFGPSSALFNSSSTRSNRSASSSSSSSFISLNEGVEGPSSLNEILSLSRASERNASLTSFNSSRRPSCFSILEVEEEKAEFGEKVIGVLEPRNSVGFWGMKEVLEGDDIRRKSC